jgi:signal transduction histidine kinase
MSRRGWGWLGAALVVAVAAIASLVVFGSYESGYGAAATDAAGAELAVSRLNALQSEAIADGRLPPGVGMRVRRLLDAVRHDLQLAGAGGAGPWHDLRAYGPAVRASLQLLAAGQVTRARQLDDRRVDPVYASMGVALRRLTQGSDQAAGRADRLAEAGGIAAVSLGFLVVATLLARFAATRRAAAVAEVEHQLVRSTDRARSELISVVSHDLRTPLTSIIGYLEMFQDGSAGPVTAEQQAMLSVMRRNGGRLRAIADDLLFIARVRDARVHPGYQELSLADLAARTVEAYRAEAAAAGIGLSMATGPAAPVTGDPAHLSDLVGNLLSNAVKFTPAGGAVRVTVHQAGDQVRLEVADTGPGIFPEDQEHLFEHFFRSPDMAGMPGVGLGLAIVKAIADAHRARVSVHSAPGQGAIFRVDFPPAGAPALADGPGQPGPGQPGPGRTRPGTGPAGC